MFTLRIPNRLINLSNPIFAAELHRVRRLRSAQSLTRYGLAVLLVPFVALMVWWLLIVLAFALADGPEKKFAVYSLYVNVMKPLLLTLLVATPISALLLDMYSMLVTVNSISHEMNTRQWELLRLTPLHSSTYITAKHTIAQVRAWRMLVLEISIRMLGLVLLIVSTTFMESRVWSGFYTQWSIRVWPLVDDMKKGFEHDALGTLAGFSVFFMFVAAYILEPLWRMRGLTALGLAISSSIRSLPFAALAAFAALLAVHLVEAMIIFGIVKAGEQLEQLVRYATVWSALAEAMLIIGLLALFWRTVYRAALGYAQRAIFDTE